MKTFTAQATILLLCLVTLVTGCGYLQPKPIVADPVGQVAKYKVDTAKSRTSGFIKSGEISTFVLSHDAERPIFLVEFRYDLDTALGPQYGKKVLEIPEEFFLSKFLTDLRANGTFESAEFKATHLGYQDAVNLSGKTYPNCDKVSVRAKSTEGDMVDAVVLVKPGLPVLGAVKVDLVVEQQGLSFKVGADYIE